MGLSPWNQNPPKTLSFTVWRFQSKKIREEDSKTMSTQQMWVELRKNMYIYRRMLLIGFLAFSFLIKDLFKSQYRL